MKRSAVLILVLGAVGCDRRIDRDKLEDVIGKGLTGMKVVVKSIECPGDQPAKHGENFACTVRTDHQQLTIDITQTDDDGDVLWKARGLAYDEKALGDGLEAQIGQGIDVTCPAQMTIIEVGDVLTCETKHPDGHVQITMKDDKGTVTWKLVP